MIEWTGEEERKRKLWIESIEEERNGSRWEITFWASKEDGEIVKGCRVCFFLSIRMNHLNPPFCFSLLCALIYMSLFVIPHLLSVFIKNCILVISVIPCKQIQINGFNQDWPKSTSTLKVKGDHWCYSEHVAHHCGSAVWLNVLH